MNLDRVDAGKDLPNDFNVSDLAGSDGTMTISENASVTGGPAYIGKAATSASQRRGKTIASASSRIRPMPMGEVRMNSVSAPPVTGP